MAKVTYYCKLCREHGITCRTLHLTQHHNAKRGHGKASSRNEILEAIFISSQQMGRSINE